MSEQGSELPRSLQEVMRSAQKRLVKDTEKPHYKETRWLPYDAGVIDRMTKTIGLENHDETVRAAIYLLEVLVNASRDGSLIYLKKDDKTILTYSNEQIRRGFRNPPEQ